jgi:glycosyltransferase involved in cell wall biosynthesis
MNRVATNRRPVEFPYPREVHVAETRRLISVVTPCYNEQDNVRDCAAAVRAVFERRLPGYDFEHVFCDNGSTDRTPDELRRLAAEDRRVKVILNARNFGPFCSTFNGLLRTRGDAVLVMLPADLQDPPELLPEFVRRWEEGHQVVYGIRTSREEGFLMRRVRRLYYWTVSKFADIHIPPNVGEFQLVDRVVVEALRRFEDHYPYIRGMIANCGFRTTGFEYTWKSRRKGFSKNRLYHLIDQGLNGLVSFTKVPLRLCLLGGFLLAALSILYAAVSLVVHLCNGGSLAQPGIPTLIVALFFFSGVQLFFFGVLGEYMAAVHFQVRKRPLVIEKERINFAEDAAPPGPLAA